MTGRGDNDINKDREPRCDLAKRLERLKTGPVISTDGLNENQQTYQRETKRAYLQAKLLSNLEVGRHYSAECTIDYDLRGKSKGSRERSTQKEARSAEAGDQRREGQGVLKQAINARRGKEC
jgi:hypothetical protein